MPSELIDVFDDLGRHQGVVERVDAHAQGLWHQVFHVLVVAERGDGWSAILQRRAAHKTTFAGLVDLSATGHLAAGEQPRDGVRELSEELGVDLDPSALIELGVRRMVDETVEGVNREFCHVFLARDDRPLSGYDPDPAEVSGVVEVRVDDLFDLVTGHVDTIAARELPTGSTPGDVHLTQADLVPEPPLGQVWSGTSMPYWAALAMQAQRLAAGETRLSM